jgi:hypothetical protein
MALRSVGPRFLFIAPHDDNPIPQFRLRGVSEALASSKKEKYKQAAFIRASTAVRDNASASTSGPILHSYMQRVVHAANIQTNL